MKRTSLDGDVCAASSGAVGVEEETKAGRSARNGDAATVCRRCDGSAERKTNDVIEAAGEVFGGETDPVGEELLFDAGGPSLAGFRLQRRVAEVAEIVAKDLVEARLLDALAVENAVEGIAPNSLAITQSQGCSGARHNPRG